METKKTKRADLQNRRMLFMEIGLVVGLAVVVGTFAWGTPEKNVGQVTLPALPGNTDVMVNTEHKKEPPRMKPIPIQAHSDFIRVVRKGENIDTDTPYFPEPDPDAWVIKLPVEEKPLDDIPPIGYAEEMPKFRGGDLDAFRNWVLGRIVYPRIAQDNNIQGKVTIKFVIERDGSLTNIEEIASPYGPLSEEVVRVLKQSPKWTPGKQRNKTVRVFYILPIDFILQR